ncbi:MAG: glycosyltransferase family 2 protein [Archaeoglobaceae archaeon]
MRALMVILNKDNAEKLGECLESLVNQTAKLCDDFEILVLDGASKDDSPRVAESFAKRYPCVKFKVQEKLGGTGYARREVCDLALKDGYDVVIWGDSENVYSRDYVEKILKALEDCEVAGGVPIVRGNFFAHAFAWYHAIHIIFNIYDKHIPGNNKAEKTRVYEICKYPESKRADDYGFSLLLMKKRIKLRQRIVDARVFVSVPETMREVFKWQRARVKGCAEALRLVDFKPYDLLAWSLFLPLLVFSLLAVPFSPIFAVIPLLLVAFSIWVFFKSLKFIEKPRKLFFFAPLIGFAIHSLFSILGLYYYLKD